MMDPSDINSFENQWKKAFQEASEAPPPSVWENIEARLDTEQGKVVPLWWQSTKIWYAAASIAALLLVGGGIWYSGRDAGSERTALTNSPMKEGRKQENGRKQEDEIEGKPAEKGEAKVAKSDLRQNGLPKQNEPAGNDAKNVSPETSEVEIASVNKQKPNGAQITKSFAEPAGGTVADVYQKPRTPDGNPALPNIESAHTLPGNAVVKEITSGPELIAANSESNSVGLLNALPYNDLDVHVQKRYVFFRPQMQIEEPVKTSKKKEYWAGVGIMPASFNPDVKLKEAPMVFSSQSVANKRSVSGNSESGISYALQTQGGMRLSKHWSVEAGLSYLRGNSDYQGGGYVLNAYNSAAANVLENALAGLSSPNASPSFADKTSNFDNGALYIDVAKKVSNNYQYLQLPVQAGFTLNPDKRLSYSLLGGMMANFFLTNELESASGEIIKTTANDEIYRSMNWAATTGLRFNYRLSSKWAANLTGSYQRAVSSGFKSNQSLESLPYLYGVSWAVRYSF
nr:outer membrane beta-barrel protein [uncultured Dyadobacter sp.]